jgi:FtsZ-binding cell division protein ZapB
MATKEKVVDLKPTSITDEQLKSVQTTISNINRSQMEIGKLESQKHSLLHQINGLQEELGKLQTELEKEYGTVDINIQTGEINYDVEADKKN